MTIRAAGRQSRQWVVQAVHIDSPPITSPAALALLTKAYFLADKSIFSEARMSRLRHKWMKNLMKNPDEQGGLTCVLCGQKGLSPYTADIDNQATLDHIIELKCGGAWNDPTNFQLACYKCNNHKSNVQQPRTSKKKHGLLV
jgi:5-methylcytosine-specific restriction endonuclease McrA